VRFCAIAKCTSDLTNSAFILYSLVSVLVVCFAFEVFTTQTVKIVKGCLLCELSVFDWYGMTFFKSCTYLAGASVQDWKFSKEVLNKRFTNCSL
jgi:hypothetical protein